MPTSSRLALAAALCAGPLAAQPLADPALEARARAVHERVMTLDSHVDIDVAHFGTGRPNYAGRLPGTRADLAKMEAGGLDAVFLAVYVGQGPLTAVGYADARAQAMAKFAAIHRLVDTLAPARVGLARTAGDARRIHASGRTVVFIGVENGYPVGADLAALGRFHALGARTMSLVHNGHSQLADSHTGERDGVWLHGGLSPLGRRAIAEMNRLGIIVDVSHASRASAMQSIALSRAPVVATHSAMRALCDRSRNLDDEQLRAIARAGGVAQVVAVAGHLRCGRARAAASVRDLVDHVDHAVRVAGIDHVGISSDFDGGGGVDGWRGADETINVTRELVRRGYTEPEIERLWGGNLLRVLDRVQQVARELRDAPPGRAPPRRAPPGRAVSRGAGW